MALTLANIKAITDSIGYKVQLAKTALGDVSTGTTLLGAAQDNLDRILAFADTDKQRYIQDAYKNLIAELSWENLLANYLQPVLSAIQSNLQTAPLYTGKVGISETWAQAALIADTADRLAPEFAEASRAAGMAIDPSIIFPPVTDLATMTLTGAGAGTVVLGDTIDTTLYGGGDIETVVDVEINAQADVVVTVKGIAEDGVAEEWTTTITKGAKVGDVDALVSSPAGKRCIEVTLVTVTGGAASDKFTVRTKVDRTITG